MLGEVERKALGFNQKLNNLIKIPHLFRWDSEGERWIYEKPAGISLFFYCLSVSVMPSIVAVILACGVAIYSNGVSPSSLGLPAEVLILYILIVLFGVEYMLQEALLLQFGRDLKNLVNAEMDIVSLYNIQTPQGRDWIGMIMMTMITSLIGVLTVTPLIFVYFGWDIFTLTTNLLLTPWRDTIQSSPLFPLAKVTISPFFFQPFALSLRNFFLALVMLNQFALRYFGMIKKLAMSSKAQHHYLGLSILLAHIQDFARYGWAMACSCVFFILIFGINLIIFCFRSQNYPVLLCTVVMLTVATAVFQYMLEVDSSFPSFSQKLLYKWMWDLKFYAKSNPIYFRYFQKVIRSTRLVAFNIGCVGVIDRQLRINFFDAVLIYTVNILVAFN